MPSYECEVAMSVKIVERFFFKHFVILYIMIMIIVIEYIFPMYAVITWKQEW